MQQHQPDEIAYGIYRSACVKEFEIIEEQCGSLLKKRLRDYFASNREANTLSLQRHLPPCCQTCLDYGRRV